jgi:hypothetical protein
MDRNYNAESPSPVRSGSPNQYLSPEQKMEDIKAQIRKYKE